MEDRPVRILLVDDDEDDYVITQDLLSEIGDGRFDLEWVASYEDALETMERRQHDVYLVDYHLGQHNGLDLLRKAPGNGSQAPMILLTGQGDHEVDLEAMKAGAADFLVKGQIQASLLERSIRYAIERAQTLKALRASEATNRALLAETQRRLKEQIALREAGAVISSALDLETVLTRIAEQMAKVIDATSAYICSYEPGTETSTVLAEYVSTYASLQEQTSDLGVTYHLPPDFSGSWLPTGLPEVTHLDDPGLSPPIRAHLNQYGAQTALNIPLQIRDQTIAFAQLWESRRQRDFTAEDIELCQALAQQAAVAIENARLYEQAQHEIEERQQAEKQIEASLKEKETLLKEIHHRVKNNLQVISSILNLQCSHVDDQKLLAVLRDSKNRVRSMALIHEKLYLSSNLAQIDLADYVQDLARYLFSSYRTITGIIRLDIQADPVFLEIDTAVPCGLILNELISNALEHAFYFDGDRPTDWEAEIHIEVHQERDRQVNLIVSDNGIGLPPDFDFLNSNSLGLQLVDVLVNQLDGTLAVNGQHGAEFKITFFPQD